MLGIEIESTINFVCRQLPNCLPAIIERGGTLATQVLTELTTWVAKEHEAAQKQVVEAINSVAFVPNMDGQLVAPKNLLDPTAKVVRVFKEFLRSSLPRPDFVEAHRILLIGLGMSKYLEPRYYFRIANPEHAFAEHVAPLCAVPSV